MLFSSLHRMGRFEVLGGGSLQIFNLTKEDAGIYTCQADNVNASIEAQAELTLKGKDLMLKELTVVCYLIQNTCSMIYH